MQKFFNILVSPIFIFFASDKNVLKAYINIHQCLIRFSVRSQYMAAIFAHQQKKRLVYW